MKTRPLISEGGVFAIPDGGGRCLYAQLWTIDHDGVIGHCGVASLIGKQGMPPPAVNWSDPRIYDRELNLIIDREWLRPEWPVISGYKPAKTPLRDEEPVWCRLAYDFFGWRPFINSFVDADSAQAMAKQVIAARPNA